MNASPKLRPQERFVRFIRHLAEPSPTLASPLERTLARTLAFTSIGTLVTIILPALARVTLWPTPQPIRWYVYLTAVAILGVYFISRTRYYRLGIYATVLVYSLGSPVIDLALPHIDRGTFMLIAGWNLGALIIAGLLLSRREFLRVIAVNIVLLSIPSIGGKAPWEWYQSLMLVFLAEAALLFGIAGASQRHARAMAKNERRFRELFNSTLEALVIHDGAYILAVNPAFEKMFRCTEAEAIGREPISFVAPEARQAAWEAFLDNYDNPDAIIRATAMRCDGTRFEAEASLGMVTYEGQDALALSVRDISWRVEAEAKIHKLQQAVEQSANAIVITNREGIIEYVNAAFTQMTGYTAEEAIGQNPRILKSGYHPSEFYQQMWETLEQGQIWHGEILNKRKDGSLYWERETISPVMDDEGRILHYIAIKEDITAQKASEEEIHKLKQAIEQSANAIAITNRHGIIEYVNPAFTQLTGYTAEEVIGRNPRVLKSGKHPKKFYTELWRTILKGQVWHNEIINKRKDGTLYWERMSITPVKNAEGEITHFIAIKEDITRQKEDQERIRLLLKAIEQSNTAVFIVAANGTIEYANPAALQFTGYSDDELIGTSADMLMKAKANLSHYPDFVEHIRQRKPWQNTSLIQRKDGGFRWALVNIAPIIPEENPNLIETDAAPVRFVMAATDITERKQLEEALRQARDRAEEASQLKTQLLGNVSHDMRTPLGGILGYSEMLLDGAFGELTPGQRKAILHILESTQQLINFTNDLINQAELESGRLRLNITQFPPRELLKTVPASQAIAEAKGVRVHTEIDPHLPETIYGDPYWLRQILANLLGNAIKFTDKGHIWVRLLGWEGDRWAIEVEDTGVGIPPEDQKHIFEPFRQVDGSPTRRHQGSGLGLSIVKQLVEMMHGEIRLESTPGKGSKFTVILPCQAALAEESQEPEGTD